MFIYITNDGSDNWLQIEVNVFFFQWQQHKKEISKTELLSIWEPLVAINKQYLKTGDRWPPPEGDMKGREKNGRVFTNEFFFLLCYREREFQRSFWSVTLMSWTWGSLLYMVVVVVYSWQVNLFRWAIFFLRQTATQHNKNWRIWWGIHRQAKNPVHGRTDQTINKILFKIFTQMGCEGTKKVTI